MLVNILKKNDFAVFALMLIALFILLSTSCARKNVPVMPPNQILEISAPTKTPVNSNKQTNSNQKSKMNDAKLTAVAPGNWGEIGTSLIVEDGGVKIEYDCANGEIKSPLLIDANGDFEAEGTYTPESFGPVREDNPPKSQSARYKGKISGDTLAFKVTLTETNQSIGDFTLTRNKYARLRKCR